MKVTLTKEDAQEVLHKLSVLADSPDLRDEYSLTESQAEALASSVPCNGGEWNIDDEWSAKVVQYEMRDHCVVLRDIAADARAGNDAGAALRICKQAKRFEKIFAL